jgi:REP element-mobilizing transposase RayT
MIPKYRRKTMYGTIRQDVRQIIIKLCKMKNVDLIQGAVCADHVHLYVAIPPKLSVSSFMGYLKGKSALMLFDAHPEYKQLPPHDQLQHVCDIIDRHIHCGYEIFDRGTDFDAYIESRLALIDIPNKDEAFLREKLYEMYRFPEVNYRKAIESLKK